jgi:parallel beta-helix repeat protein
VHLACTTGFALVGNVSDANQVYGIFPVVSQHGVVTDNEAKNTPLDAALYIGQSDDVLIARNDVQDSLIGIEVENSRHCAVEHNRTVNNTGGILVDLLPNLTRNTQETTIVASNEVANNNRPNTGEPGDLTSLIPSGTGILLSGADTTTVTGNVVTGNDFSGIVVSSFCIGAALLGQPCTGLDIDPDPDGNRVVGNVVLGNGMAPDPTSPVAAFAADLTWDGSGTGNCWSRNRFETSVPATLPACDSPGARLGRPVL